MSLYYNYFPTHNIYRGSCWNCVIWLRLWMGS